MHDVPVLLVIFNRPEKTRAVINALTHVKPKRLFVSADGPRKDNPDDAEKCVLARELATCVDWDCDVKTRFLDENLGCGLGVSTGISWFFEHVERGIILEDDCVPHPHFFPFCGELLEKYANDTRIMRISGLSPFPERKWPYDYHFSRKFFTTGWGTWQRAWRHFTFNLNDMNHVILSEALKNYYPFYHNRRYWLQNMKQLLDGGRMSVWDMRWDLCCLLQNGLTICPENNLITNIGFDDEGTHTHKVESVFANLETKPLAFPLRHPPFVCHDGRQERALEQSLYKDLSSKSRLAWHVKRILGAVTDYAETLPLRKPD